MPRQLAKHLLAGFRIHSKGYRKTRVKNRKRHLSAIPPPSRSRKISITMKNTYHPSLEKLVCTALATDVANPQGHTLEFARFSTALYQYRADIPLAQHESIFQDACAYQALAAVEESCPWWQGRLQSENPPRYLLGRTSIIATFHTGSYRLLPRWLHMHGIPFSLVVSRTVNLSQGRRFHALAGNPVPEIFDIIDAEDPSALLSMRRALCAGRHLLIYTDGNTGARPLSAKHSVDIPFLDSHLRVRTGLANLAYLANAPIVPVIQQRRCYGDSPFKFQQPIQASHHEKRAHFAQNIMLRLYRMLEQELHEDPAQWENWFHLRPFSQPTAESERVLSGSADAAWITVCSGEDVYRVDRKTGTCFPIG